MKLPLLALVPALLLAACTTTPAGPPAPTEDPALVKLRSQQLSWGACPPQAASTQQKQAFEVAGAECARLTVPLDHTKPGDKTITLGLLRLAATDRERRIGSLVFNPGGPGQSGMSHVAETGPKLREGELGKRFDLVGFDPRGVGASEPKVRCLTDAERDAQRLFQVRADAPDAVARTEAEAKSYADRCAERVGKDNLAVLGTREVAKDLDILRAALGDAKLSYVGYSYGTRIGTAYAEAYPANVRALVLDGAVDPNQDLTAQQFAQVEGFDKAFAAFAESCAKQAACALGRNPAKAEDNLDALTEPLRETPLKVGDRVLSHADAGTALTAALYAQEQWPTLNLALLALQAGQGELLLAFADAYLGRAEDGTYGNDTDLLLSVNCVDTPPLTDRAKVEAATRTLVERSRARRGGPRPDEPVAALDPCAFWPAPPTSTPHQPKADGLPRTVVVSTTGDPATPHAAGVALASALKADLVTVEATQHGTFLLRGNSCVDDPVTKYLLDPATPVGTPTCR
ncbi:pimeloyl-ACP methyl ester carboxylesterase [Crossiella equi]|uniref:Pimeloyl-ACP methyl ester carboxylesterase n=1 Tax=Crossiella equi TaxID=130796 RepID=A0ABS5ABB0_9PSEU|nr:alpha/beta hydrolase [Crossiella equi]MBP2473866.1 pimeloyl-ACP methyl ester carboxylesterase [Crossiella equi]